MFNQRLICPVKGVLAAALLIALLPAPALALFDFVCETG